MNYCLYYQAHIKKELCWFFVGVLRSFEHMAFDRTVEKETSLFEFFVPADMKDKFQALMNYFLQQGIVIDFEEKENRLKLINSKI